MSRLLFVSVLIAANLSAQPESPVEPINARRLYEILDAGGVEGLAEQDLDHLYRLLEAGRPVPSEVLSGEALIAFEDDFGRKTDIYLKVPKEPKGVIVLLHGLGANARQLTRGIYDRIVEEQGLIVLAPSARPEPKDHENTDIGKIGRIHPHWWSYDERGIVMTALRDLARRIPFDRDRVYLSGLSMGGFGSWNIGLRYADRFAAAAPISGGLSRREYIGSKPHRSWHKLLDNARHLPFFFAHGSEDRLVPVRFDRHLHAGLKAREVEHTYLEVEGGRHLLDLRANRRVMKELRGFLAGKTRDPHPERVLHRVIENRPSRSFWLRIDEIWASSGLVDGRIEEGNRIVVKASGVTRLTVFLDEHQIDPDQPVTLVVNGAVVHDGPVAADLDGLLESWRDREDPAFVCRRILRVKVP